MEEEEEEELSGRSDDDGEEGWWIFVRLPPLISDKNRKKGLRLK